MPSFAMPKLFQRQLFTVVGAGWHERQMSLITVPVVQEEAGPGIGGTRLALNGLSLPLLKSGFRDVAPPHGIVGREEAAQ